MSRRISCGYSVFPASTRPPPPKQPQSMLSPRAHDCAMPATSTASNSSEAPATQRVASPASSSSPSTSSSSGSPVATGRTSACGSTS